MPPPKTPGSTAPGPVSRCLRADHDTHRAKSQESRGKAYGSIKLTSGHQLCSYRSDRISSIGPGRDKQLATKFNVT